MCWGLNAYGGGWSSTLLVGGLYTHYKDSIVKGGTTIPNIREFRSWHIYTGVGYKVDLDPNHHKPLGSGGKSSEVSKNS